MFGDGQDHSERIRSRLTISGVVSTDSPRAPPPAVGKGRSTRRFFARPSSVWLEATGARGPTPEFFRRPAAMRCLVISASTTASARASGSFKLCNYSPVSSGASSCTPS